MAQELTAPVAARIPLSLLADIHNELQESNKNMSQFIQEALEEKLTNNNKEFLDAEILKKETELKILREKRETVAQIKKDIFQVPKEEIPFLLETKKIVDRDPTFITGRIQLYKNKFRKRHRISEQDFLLMMDNAAAEAQVRDTVPEVADAQP